MRNRLLTALLSATALAMALTGCSDFDEMQTLKLQLQAERLLADGESEQAEAILAELIARYPDSRRGAAARQQLKTVQMRRIWQESQAFGRLVESYLQVFGGYQTLYGRYPTSLAELDNSDYFFDSEYLQQLTGAAYQVYLWLPDDHHSFEAWFFADDQDQGYRISAAAPEKRRFDRDRTLADLQEAFRVVDRKGNLLVVRPK
ncbi:MAG: hypothetical protein RQ723_00405 [Desulfuromonadales bacterium]|nr:hypothetical protein [Desulfuromonadales bacterium]